MADSHGPITGTIKYVHDNIAAALTDENIKNDLLYISILYLYYMAGKKRSGLAAHRRGYGVHRYFQITYTVTYNRNSDISGNPIIEGSSP